MSKNEIWKSYDVLKNVHCHLGQNVVICMELHSNYKGKSIWWVKKSSIFFWRKFQFFMNVLWKFLMFWKEENQLFSTHYWSRESNDKDANGRHKREHTWYLTPIRICSGRSSYDPLQEGMSCIVTFSMSLLTPRGSSWSPAHLHSRKGVYRPPGDGRWPPPTWTWASISYKLWSYSRYSAARSKFKTYVFPIGFPTVTAHYHFRCTNQHDNSLGNPTVNSRTRKCQHPTIFSNELHCICCNSKVYRS